MNGVSRAEDFPLARDHGVIRVIGIACVTIVLAVLLAGSANYWITQSAIVEKLKARDFVYIMESIAAKVDGRLELAREASALLASDRLVYDWVMSDETDERLGWYAKLRVDEIASRSRYTNASIASARTSHYWAEGMRMIQTMREGDPAAQWFFDGLRSGERTEVRFDYNIGRDGRYIFVNTLIGDRRSPVGIASVGLDLVDLQWEFKKYKFGEKSSLWLVDEAGRIYLSDNFDDQGKNLGELLPQETFERISGDFASVRPQVLEYENAAGVTMDIAYQPTKFTDWKLVFQMPREENTVLLKRIQNNTLAASFFILGSMVFIFYLVSYKIADPLARAMRLNQEMKRVVAERTQELAEKNRQIMDGIEYARQLQDAMLPAGAELAGAFADSFVMWRPRDLVGGDFYWLRRRGNRLYLAVADCTGHGVPGALMTMAANAVLNGLVDQGYDAPAEILTRLHRRLQKTLHRGCETAVTDDGLDIVLCRVEDGAVTYAGARLPLYVKRNGKLQVLKGDRSSVGYRTEGDVTFRQQVWTAEPGDSFYLATDGLIDQNGGEKNFSFGRKHFLELLEDNEAPDMAGVQSAIEQALLRHQGAELQRDDITVLGFRLK